MSSFKQTFFKMLVAALDRTRNGLQLPVIILVSLSSFCIPVYAQTEKPLKDIKFLGLSLIDSSIKDVRDHLWKVGGFSQAKSTVKQHNFDKFFSRTSLIDSYFVSFEYNFSGQIIKAKRLYRPSSLENNNRHTPITTFDIARSLIEELGKPTNIKRKSWGGSLSYPSYRWEDETMEIVLDREGSERLGNVFIEYRIKTHDRFSVDKNNKKGNNA